MPIKPKPKPDVSLQVSIPDEIKQLYDWLNEQAKELGIELDMRTEMREALIKIVRNKEKEFHAYREQNQIGIVNGSSAAAGRG